MRILLWKCKQFVKNFAVFMVAVILGVLAFVCTCERFSALSGEKVFYLNSASSQGLRKQTLSFLDLGNVKGESVRVELNGEDSEAFAKRIIKKYNAKLICVERVAGTTSYYAYTPNWSNGVSINGRKVNLHVAFSGNSNICVVGNPIIFDGY